ncbi:RDD family protein [Alcaligenaceae bacterium 429]|nr:RDD family protein [Alcaligenaceae bacterium 429]
MASSAVPVSLPVPSRRRLFASMMYESILLFGIVFLVGLIFDYATKSYHALYLRHSRQFLIFLAIGLYFMLAWRRAGQTLPMKTWYIRLETKQGTKPGYVQLLLRYLLMWPIPLACALLVQYLSTLTGYASTDLLIVAAPFSIFVWSWFDRDGLFMHDRLAGTRLVDLQARITKQQAKTA